MQHDYIKLLINSAQQGRKNAFIDLCELSAKKIYTLCYRMLVNHNLAKVVTLEIFKQAWENIRFIREDISFDIWLKGISVFTILDEIRSKKRRKELEKKKENIAVEKAENIDRLELMILSLPEKERVIFILHEIENYSYPEISDFMHEYSSNEIKFIVQSTRRKLIEVESHDL